MEMIELVGSIACIITIVSFLTGGQICHQIYRKRSTADFMAFPFQAGVFSTGLWLQYGVLLNDATMKFVNSIGLSTQLAYLVFFYIFTSNRSRLGRENMLLASFLSLVHLYGRYSPEQALSHIGLLGCAASLILTAAPLASLSDVLRTRSTHKLPFSLILSSFMVSISWYAYGYLINDSYVALPSAVNSLVSGLQLSLFLIFPSKQHAD